MDLTWPTLSIVVACRNERTHIGPCLDSLLASTYPPDRFEILVVDGMSTDGTRDIVADYGARNPRVRLVDNPRQITPTAFNAGIHASTADVIAIVGSHAVYAPTYMTECVRHLMEHGADQAGGVAIYEPREATEMGRALAAVLAHPLGAGANVRYKVGASKPTWVDTVSSGCYRRDVFRRVGYFNEQLVFSQDIEFNGRMRRAGGRILLVPTAVIRYAARSDLPSFLRHTWRNGVWSSLPLFVVGRLPGSWRHLIPCLWVLSLVGAAILTTVTPWGWIGLLPTAGAYGVAVVGATLWWSCRTKDWSTGVRLPLVFALLHLVYGLGTIWGFVAGAGRTLRGDFKEAAYGE